MKGNILKNVTLDAGERIQKDFQKLRAQRRDCQIVLTTKRLIIYTFGMSLARGRKVKRRMMNETDLHAIHQFEYYIDYSKNRAIFRLFGFILFLGALALAYVHFSGLYPLPVFPYSEYGYYAGAGIVALIGLSITFKTKKALTVKIKSGLNDVSTLSLKASRYNELAIRYLASKIHVK
ncbi:MAG: hypothetical protein WC351_05810 [Candidatus Izemoplasmatales bacterium]|jgi:hypothetical protein